LKNVGIIFKGSLFLVISSFFLGNLYKRKIIFYNYLVYSVFLIYMEPKILDEKTFKLLGCVFYGNPFHSAQEWTYENEIGRLWERFGKLYYNYFNLFSKICKNWNVGYELHLETEEYRETKNYYVMVGMEVDNIEDIPLEMFVKILPKIKYIVFTTTMQNKNEVGFYIYKKWLSENGYEQSYPYLIQGYDRERYKDLNDPKSEIDWYIPVKILISQ